MAELIIQSGKHQGKKLILPDGELFVGRDDDCQIRLNSDEISRRHCVLRVSADAVTAEDLGSSNGTFVNDVLVEVPTEMKPGDVLRVGPMLFQVPRAVPKAADRRARQGDEISLESPPSGDAYSDEDIVSWLAGDSDVDASTLSTGDTTIISGRSALRSTSEPTPQPRSKFRSIAEEAADIIRRHREMLLEEEGEDF